MKNEKINKHNEELGLTGRWDGDPTGLVVTTLEDALERRRMATVAREKRIAERKRLANEKASESQILDD